MNIQEILNMLDEDIARAEEQQPDNKEENIDFLLSELEASRELDEDRLAEKYLAMHTMYQFLTRPGNLIKILDCKDQLTLGECLPMLIYSFFFQHRIHFVNSSDERYHRSLHLIK